MLPPAPLYIRGFSSLDADQISEEPNRRRGWGAEIVLADNGALLVDGPKPITSKSKSCAVVAGAGGGEVLGTLNEFDLFA